MKKNYSSPEVREMPKMSHIDVCDRPGMGMCKVTFK